VVARDEEHDWLAAVLVADMEVAKAAEIAEVTRPPASRRSRRMRYELRLSH
jgi:hypothetical protein